MAPERTHTQTHTHRFHQPDEGRRQQELDPAALGLLYPHGQLHHHVDNPLPTGCEVEAF